MLALELKGPRRLLAVLTELMDSQVGIQQPICALHIHLSLRAVVVVVC
eukprot:COSAG05_NODE_87_length_20404_cov_42.272051_17_plen_48_part_00